MSIVDREIFSSRNFCLLIFLFSTSNDKIVKHFSEYTCEEMAVWRYMKPIGSLPGPRGDLIHVCKCTDPVNVIRPL